VATAVSIFKVTTHSTEYPYTLWHSLVKFKKARSILIPNLETDASCTVASAQCTRHMGALIFHKRF
jgi:hypothetical protein